MKFRTEIVPRPSGVKIGYENRILALGSCFADRLAEPLRQVGMRIAANPTGVLFNPLSIADAVERAAEERWPRRETLRQSAEGWWFDWGFHGSFSSPDPDRATERMRGALQRLADALKHADRVIVTFGTAMVYELRPEDRLKRRQENRQEAEQQEEQKERRQEVLQQAEQAGQTERAGRMVANCHKQPQELFRRRMLSIDEIVGRWHALLEGPLAGKQIILTLSPVRHLADGAEVNSLSKAVLRVAIDRIAALHPERVSYFPAAELLLDDLRDYGFYADDLAHPAPRAEAYIRERFFEAAFTPETRRQAAEIERLRAAAHHRPLHENGAARQLFVQNLLERIARAEAATGCDLQPLREALNDPIK